MTKIALFSVVLNHHQALLADELYEQTNHQFVFVELVAPTEENMKGGGNIFSTRPYLIKSWKDNKSKHDAINIALTAEVVLFGGGLEYLRLRMKKELLTFEVGERWLKRGWLNLLSPRLLKNIFYYHVFRWERKPLYKLCCSAYAAKDQYSLHSYKNKCYKWGYFTKVEDFDEDLLIHNNSISGTINMMWCARFLKWKHPELVILLARKLKDNGCHVLIDMYGDGVELESAKYLCNKLDVSDVVNFRGNVQNRYILEAMHQHDIFLFTSDKNEGWGVVLNEAMSNGCTVVASNSIGSVPFLIQDGENGMVFKSGDIDSLYEKVVYLIENPVERFQMSVKAYQTMKNVWSPRQAACNLIKLSEDLLNGRETKIIDGPCSRALPIKD